MLFYLSKIVFIFLKPITWIVFLSLLSLITKRKKLRKWATLGSISLIIFFSNPAILNLVLSIYEGQATPFHQLDNDYDFVILLGGFSNLDKEDGTAYSMNERGNRLLTTMELYKQGNAAKILMTGGSGDIWQDKASEALVVQDFLLRMDMDSSDILVESKSRNTYENAKFTKELLNELQQGNAKCLLVTSAFHMPRAKRLFIKQGIDITPYPTDFMNRPLNRPDHIFLPSGKTLWLWDLIIKEWVGIISYRIAGKL